MDAIDLRGLVEGFLARQVAERGPSRELLRELRICLADGDAIFQKRHLVESDEVAYAQMNGRFHELIVAEAESSIFADVLVRNAGVPFASPEAVAFDGTDLEKMYDALHFAHHQHHCLVEALESNQGARAEAMMREHVNTVKRSINMIERRNSQLSGLRKAEPR